MNDLFLTNYTKISFLDKIKNSFNRCKKFYLSVSFIKKAGLILIEREIEEALERGVIGKIITSTYQNFTDIASLKTFKKWMDKYSNFECHLDYMCFGDNGFHSKGYLFEYADEFEFIVGSTNITRFALLKNVEWNVSLQSKNTISSFNEAHTEFNNLWNKTLILDDSLISNYTKQLDFAIEKWDMDYFSVDSNNIKPNSMQRKALKELRRNRDLGVKRSLVVAATGSGKTYLAAFDARNYDAKRLLFVVHRDAILVEAKKTFEKVFGAERSYGLYTGKYQDLDADFIFTTNTMMFRHLKEFNKNEFDYIVLDECHHSTNNSYSSIMKYFNAGFILGLTATPERMDNQDVFGLFENNVPFELRLRDAILNDLVVPFHYYAIRDDFADYSASDKSKIAREIARTANVNFIASQIEKYKKPNEKLKCIAFCTSVEHARTMSLEFLNLGYSSVSLTGKNDLGERIKAFHDLQDENNELEIICTVDILNEGVDIPAVNMVLFLRPTESATIFLQQLGRGLRKYENKEYLTVLDFIGNNYDRSVQIALALGTLSKATYTEKAYLKDLVNTNFKTLQIPGVEIFIDDLSKTEIIAHLDKVNFNKKKFLKSDYLNFKKYLNKDTIPTHMDYLDSEIAPDLMRFMKSTIGSKKNKSYYTFLTKIGEEGLPLFNDEEIELIDNISELLPIVRVDEILIINQLLNKELNLKELEELKYNSKVTDLTLAHAVYVLKKKNIIKNKKLNVNSISLSLIEYLTDLINYAITRYDAEFGDYDGEFKLMGNYYKEQIQIMRLKDGFMSVKGTEFETDTKVTYCYVNLNKDSSKDERLQYKDKFISSDLFQWESEKNTTFSNSTGKHILNTKVIHLFVRKIVSEDGIVSPYTYVGTGRFTNIRESFTEEAGVKYPTLLTDIKLDNKVSEEYYLDFEIPEEEAK